MAVWEYHTYSYKIAPHYNSRKKQLRLSFPLILVLCIDNILEDKSNVR